MQLPTTLVTMLVVSDARIRLGVEEDGTSLGGHFKWARFLAQSHPELGRSVFLLFARKPKGVVGELDVAILLRFANHSTNPPPAAPRAAPLRRY